MFRRILYAALLTGLIAGLLVTGLQQLRVVPLILEAEQYETGTAAAAPHAGHDGAGEEGRAADRRLARTLSTLVANLLIGVGFALLLTAAYAVRGRSNWRSGLLWGLAGYAAFSLAPALGLPPEIPGAAAAELADRQIWWLSAAAGTAAGLALLVFAPRWAWKLVGVAAIALPHLIGAPRPEHHGGAAPEDLARAFVIASLATNLLFWLALGGLSGLFYGRFARS